MRPTFIKRKRYRDCLLDLTIDTEEKRAIGREKEVDEQMHVNLSVLSGACRLCAGSGIVLAV